MQLSLYKTAAGFVGACILACGGMAQAQDPLPLSKPKTQIVDSAPVLAQGAFEIVQPKEREINVGIGMYLIRPLWGSNPAYTRQTTTTVGLVTTTQSQDTDFSYGTAAAPRVFAEYVNGSGLGARVSWWHYDQRASEGVINVAAPIGKSDFITAPGLFGAQPVGAQTDTFNFRNRVVFDVWDFDITQRIVSTNLWQFTVGGGFRYAYISQTLDSSRVRSGDSPGVVSTGEYHARNFFNGAGPDIFLETKRAIGNGGFALYGNARTGVLFGTSRKTSTSIENTATGPGPVTVFTINVTSPSTYNILPFLESELGVEWQGTGRGAIQPFVRLGVVGQAWWGAGNGSNSAGAETNMGFFGGNLVVGFNF